MHKEKRGQKAAGDPFVWGGKAITQGKRKETASSKGANEVNFTEALDLGFVLRDGTAGGACSIHGSGGKKKRENGRCP